MKLTTDLGTAEDLDEKFQEQAFEQKCAIVMGQDATIIASEVDLGEPETSSPDMCPKCTWTNNKLMNYGTPEKSNWLCHGCAARAIQGEE